MEIMVTQNGWYVRWHSSFNNKSRLAFSNYHTTNLHECLVQTAPVTLIVLISWALLGTFIYIWGIFTYVYQ